MKPALQAVHWGGKDSSPFSFLVPGSCSGEEGPTFTAPRGVGTKELSFAVSRLGGEWDKQGPVCCHLGGPYRTMPPGIHLLVWHLPQLRTELYLLNQQVAVDVAGC